MPTDRSPQDRLAGLAGGPVTVPDAGGRPTGDIARLPAADAAAVTGAPAAADGGDDPTALRERALAAATSAYAATYGHPLEHATTGGPVRWGTSARTALLVAGALALVGAGVVVHALTQAPAAVVLAEPAVPEPPADAAPQPTDATDPTEATEPVDDAAGTAGQVVLVHVVGRVHQPGVVELPAGSRVVDAVTAAGGATTEADLSGLNLARPVVDGEQVLVPRPGEDVPPVDVAGPAPPGAPGPASGVTDLNRASLAELEALPGIGPVLASRIAAHRDQHGPFASVDDLQAVRGIGPALLADLRPLVGP